MEKSPATSLTASLRPGAAGLILATLTILLGQLLGVLFGLNEELIHGRLEASAAAVRATVYHEDEAAMKSTVDKSWRYMQRAHLHAGGLGTTAVALIVLVCMLSLPSWSKTAISLVLGGGGLGYSVFWLWAGFLAPGMGSTGAAKEALRWLAVPSSGGFVLATVAVLLLLGTLATARAEEPAGR